MADLSSFSSPLGGDEAMMCDMSVSVSVPITVVPIATASTPTVATVAAATASSLAHCDMCDAWLPPDEMDVHAEMCFETMSQQYAAKARDDRGQSSIEVKSEAASSTSSAAAAAAYSASPPFSSPTASASAEMVLDSQSHATSLAPRKPSGGGSSGSSSSSGAAMYDERAGFDYTLQQCFQLMATVENVCHDPHHRSPYSHHDEEEEEEDRTIAATSSSAASSAAASVAAASGALSSSLPSLFAQLTSHLQMLHAAFHASHDNLTEHVRAQRAQLNEQADEFVRIRLELESTEMGNAHKRDEELSDIKISEMVQREKDTDALKRKQAQQEATWLEEKASSAEKAAAEIATLKQQAEFVATQMKEMSSNQQVLMAGEAEAIATGEGEIKRIVLLPSDTFSGHTEAEAHFRLAESQFLRMCSTGGVGTTYHVSRVEYIINPKLLKRYHDFKKQLADRGEKVSERLTFHGTSLHAIEAIIKEGFRIGGEDIAIVAGTVLGTGVYTSESPIFAQSYLVGGHKSLLFTRVCPSSDSVIQKDAHGVIQQLVCKHREQVLPTYIVHFAAGVRHHGQDIQATPANKIIRDSGGSAAAASGRSGRRNKKSSYAPPPAPSSMSSLPGTGTALGGIFALVSGLGGAPTPPASRVQRQVNAISDDSDHENSDSEFKAAIALSLRTTAVASAAASPAAPISRHAIIDMSDS